jgi:hypothetical protein
VLALEYLVPITGQTDLLLHYNCVKQLNQAYYFRTTNADQSRPKCECVMELGRNIYWPWLDKFCDECSVTSVVYILFQMYL